MKFILLLILLSLLNIRISLAQEVYCEACSREAWLGDSAAINKFIAGCGVIDTVSYDSLRNPVKEKASFQTITVKLHSGKVMYSDSVYFVAEKMPEFAGGNQNLFRHLSTSIRFPEEAKRKAISGTVYVRFIVERNGELSNFKVMRGVGGGCEEEAIRVLKASPKWTPGMQKGKPVRVQYHLPVKFALK
jgi:TonB family protein